MAKITRKHQKQFASTAPSTQIGKFGSLAAGLPLTSTDPDVIQALSNYLDGWFAATVGSNSPAIEDQNALDYLWSRQLAYLFQAGVAEWDTATEYHIGSLAQDGFGRVYTSLANTNTGNALSDTTKWAPPGGSIHTKTANYSILSTDRMILADASAGGFTLTLPSAVTYPGVEILIKKIGDEGNVVTIASAAGTIDGETTQELAAPYAGITVKSNGSDWYVF